MKADVAVIGAGAIGAQTAVQLVERGLDVVLIEPGRPGADHAASYGNAAWLSSHSVVPPATPGVWKQLPGWLMDPLGPLAVRPAYLPRSAGWLWRYLASASTEAKVSAIARHLRTLLIDAPRLHAEVAERAGLSHLIDATSGLMHVWPDRAAFQGDAFGWEIRRKAGVQWSELDGTEIAAMQPDLSRDYDFGIFVPEGGHCRNPGAYVAGLADYAERRGARRLDAQATGFMQAGGRLTGVQTSAGSVSCGAAVIAAGARSRALAAQAGDRVPLETERGYHVTVEGGELPGPSIPVMVGDRKVIVTKLAQGIRCAGQVEIGGLEAAPDWRRAEILRKHLAEVIPSLDTSNAKVWMGHRPSTPDGMPVIGPASQIAGIVHAFGHGHVGLVGSARTGRLAAQLVTGETPDIDLGGFSPRRFLRRANAARDAGSGGHRAARPQ